MALAVQSGTTPSNRPISRRNSRVMTANPTRNVNTQFVVDWNNPSVSTVTDKAKTNDENLQEAFRRFREQRMVNSIPFFSCNRRLSVLRPSLPDSISNSSISN